MADGGGRRMTKAPGFLDRRRAARLMAEAGLEAVVLAQPESISYATGAFAGVASFWRRAGAAFVVIPADADAPLAAVVGDLQAADFASRSGIVDTRSHPIWVEVTDLENLDASDIAAEIVRADRARGRPQGFARPGTYDSAVSLAHLRDILGERGLSGSRIGIE